MHYLHRYLVKLDNVEGLDLEGLKEMAVSEVRDFLDAEMARISCDYYCVGEDLGWTDRPACISVAEVGPEECFRQIDEVIAVREEEISFYLEEIKKAFPDGAVPVDALGTKPKNDMPFWCMYWLIALVALDWLTRNSYFYDIESETNILTPESKADVMRHPERYFLVFADLHC